MFKSVLTITISIVLAVLALLAIVAMLIANSYYQAAKPAVAEKETVATAVAAPTPTMRPAAPVTPWTYMETVDAMRGTSA